MSFICHFTKPQIFPCFCWNIFSLCNKPFWLPPRLSLPVFSSSWGLSAVKITFLRFWLSQFSHPDSCSLLRSWSLANARRGVLMEVTSAWSHLVWLPHKAPLCRLHPSRERFPAHRIPCFKYRAELLCIWPNCSFVPHVPPEDFSVEEGISCLKRKMRTHNHLLVPNIIVSAESFFCIELNLLTLSDSEFCFQICNLNQRRK